MVTVKESQGLRIQENHGVENKEHRLFLQQEMHQEIYQLEI